MNKEKNIKHSNSLPHNGGGGTRSEFLRDILKDSILTGEGERIKNLKVYMRFFIEPEIDFTPPNLKKVMDGKENEYSFNLHDQTHYFDKKEWGVLIYTATDEKRTKELEYFLNRHPQLRKPWLGKKIFYQLAKQWERDDAKIILERSKFKPYHQFSDYEMTLSVGGKKTKEVISDIEKKYTLLPRTIGINWTIDEEDIIKFEVTNDGRLSFSKGDLDNYITIMYSYVNFILRYNKKYVHKQSKVTKENGFRSLKTDEFVFFDLPSINKTGGTFEDRNRAILDLILKGQGVYGYIGIPLGTNRANIVDLKNQKMMLVTIRNEGIYIHTENPSESQSAIRNLYSKITSLIDPDAGISTIKPRGINDSSQQGHHKKL